MATSNVPPQNRRGPPSVAPWEKIRAAFWAHEVQRQAQAKMAEQPWEPNDPFVQCGHLILDRWAAPQRKTQSPGTVTFGDLGQFVLASGRTDLYRYANGTMARPKSAIVSQIDQALPGTQKVFDIGPDRVPLWAALAGNFSVQDFWVPLARSGQVTDALELLSGQFDWTTVETSQPIPKFLTPSQGTITGMALRDALTFEATHHLPSLPLSRIVAGLVFCLAWQHFRGVDSEEFNASMVRLEDVNYGIATLAIAVAKLALAGPHDLYGSEEHWHDPNAGNNRMDDLRELLKGMLPFWEQFDSINGALPQGMKHEVEGILAAL